MKYDEIIRNSIKSVPDAYGEKTLEVTSWDRINKQMQLFLAFKDGKEITMTLFIAFRRGKRSPKSEWNWMCPSENTIKDFGEKIKEKYKKIDTINERIRKGDIRIDKYSILQYYTEENGEIILYSNDGKYTIDSIEV